MQIVVAKLTVRCELLRPQALAGASHPVAAAPGLFNLATGAGE